MNCGKNTAVLSSKINNLMTMKTKLGETFILEPKKNVIADYRKSHRLLRRRQKLEQPQVRTNHFNFLYANSVFFTVRKTVQMDSFAAGRMKNGRAQFKMATVSAGATSSAKVKDEIHKARMATQGPKSMYNDCSCF